MENWLIVGSDGLIGSYLLFHFAQSEIQLHSTSRRKERGNDVLYLDLEKLSLDSIRHIRPDVAFICAGITNMATCQNNPEQSRSVNIEGTVQLAQYLMAEGTFVIFLSSNTVFNGLLPLPGEDTSPCPVNVYGEHKAEAERQILSFSNTDKNGCVVRISKVLSPVSGIASKFLRKLNQGMPCKAFKDLKMSPISLQYVAKGLECIAIRRHPGIFHLSGKEELTYETFCREMAEVMNINQNLIQPVSYIEIADTVLFNPLYPALGMPNTKNRLGITAQKLKNTFDDFFELERKFQQNKEIMSVNE